MSIRSLRCLIAAVCLLGVSISGSAAAEEPKKPIADMVVVAIDGEPYTLKDLKDFVATLGEVKPDDVKEGKFDIPRFLHEFVTQKLLEKEAKAQGINVTDQEREAYIEEIQRQNHVDREHFVDLLKSRGLGFEQYKTQVTYDILRTRLFQAKLRQKATISDQDVERYLAEHPDRRPQSGQAHIQQVFLANDASLSLGPDASARAKLEEIRAAVKSGTALQKAAGESFRDLGYVNPEDLLPELSAAADKLEAGQISEVIETDKGFYLVYVSEKLKGEDVPITDELKEEIRKELFDAKLKKELQGYVEEDLPKKYNVEFKL